MADGRGTVDLIELGRRLHMLRWTKRLSARELDELTGGQVAANTILRYERGQVEPQATSIAALALALGTNIDYLLGLSEDPHPRLVTS